MLLLYTKTKYYGSSSLLNRDILCAQIINGFVAQSQNNRILMHVLQRQ